MIYMTHKIVCTGAFGVCMMRGSWVSVRDNLRFTKCYKTECIECYQHTYDTRDVTSTQNMVFTLSRIRMEIISHLSFVAGWSFLSNLQRMTRRVEVSPMRRVTLRVEVSCICKAIPV